MTYKTILTIVDNACTGDQLGSAIELARKTDAHLAVLAVALTPTPPVYDYGAVIVPGSWQADIQAGAEQLGAKVNEIEAQLQAADISGDVTSAYCDVVLLENVVAKRATVCDLAYLPKASMAPGIFERALSGILFKTPIAAIVDDIGGKVPMAAERIFVAWNTGREAASAVHKALPILKQAKEVTIGIFDPVMTEYDDGEEPGADVAAWLSRHGCTVTVRQVPSGGREIADCIKRTAAEQGADLIVMGAYGHSRLRQRILGGTTQSMLEQSDIPVFFGH